MIRTLFLEKRASFSPDGDKVDAPPRPLHRKKLYAPTCCMPIEIMAFLSGCEDSSVRQDGALGCGVLENEVFVRLVKTAYSKEKST